MSKELLSGPSPASTPTEGTRTSLSLSGMTCASCASRIERALKKAPGVVEAQVNLATEKATVTYLPQATSEEALCDVVAKAGYGASPPVPEVPGEDPLEAEKARRSAEQAALRNKL